MAATGRIRQGLRALFAFSQPIDRALAVEYLSPELMALFDKMRHSEQLHALNTLRTVLESGPTPRDLAVAALLHDVGKTRYPLRIWQKTLAVLVRALLPSLYQRWSRGNPTHIIQRPFVVNVHHPAWGADMLAAAGAGETAIWLVAHHQDEAARWANHAHFHLLKRLQQADDAN